MPYLIIARQGTPVISIDCTDDAHVFSVATESGAPSDACESTEALQTWLATQLPPSGLFQSSDDANVARLQVKREQDARLLKMVLAETGLTQVALAAALGLSDPRRDGSAIRKVLLGKNAMGGSTRRILAYLLKYGPMSADEADERLEKVGNGEWRVLDRVKLRQLTKPVRTGARI